MYWITTTKAPADLNKFKTNSKQTEFTIKIQDLKSENLDLKCLNSEYSKRPFRLKFTEFTQFTIWKYSITIITTGNL